MQILSDLRFSARSLARTPRFTAAALVTLALSLGVCSTTVSVIDNALFRPFTLQDPDRLVLAWESNGAKQVAQYPTSPANFLDWQRRAAVFERLAAYRRTNMDLTGDDRPERISVASVTPDFFPLFGVQPIVGTYLVSADQGDLTAVLSESFWRRRFAGDLRVVGKRLQLNDQSYVVAGVMPALFRTPHGADLWVPLNLGPRSAGERSGRSLVAYGRLRRGVSLTQAQSAMAAVAAQLDQEYPSADHGWTVTLMPLREQWIGEARTPLFILLGAVALVLFIACANVASLMLARFEARRGELAMRTALGASRGALVRGIVVEGLLLTAVGAVLSLLLTRWALAALPAFGTIAWLEGIRVDGRVVFFSLVTALITAALITAAPIFHLSRRGMSGAVPRSGGRTTAGIERRYFQRVLVVAEVGLALIVSIGAGLLLESYRNLHRLDPGFRDDGVLTARVVLPQTRYPESAQWVLFFDQLLDRLRADPRVEDAAAGTTVPFALVSLEFDVTMPGQSLANGEKGVETIFDAVTPGFFHALGLHLLQGRVFNSLDRDKSQPVAILSESLARALAGGQPVVGRQVQIGSRPPCEVVGVVRDVQQEHLGNAARPTVYVPYSQQAWEFATLVVRTSGPPAPLVEAVRHAVYQGDRNLPVFAIATMDQLIADSLMQRRFSTILLTGFALLALVLAAVGVYGLVSYQVSRSTNEMGVRIAMGAQRADLLMLVLGRVLKLIGAGVAVGLAGAFVLTRFLGHLLYSVSATDPRAFAGFALLLLLVAALAGYFPARRAMKVEPIVALRSE
jgi:putative ABC transport system permease protein